MANMKLLLLEDVDNLGRIGDVVAVKAGYARNYLIPRKKAVFANKQALGMRQKLQDERQKQADQDKQQAQAISERIAELELSIQVKVDPEGHLYGSVTALDIIELLAAQQVEIEKRHVLLAHPIKSTGAHTIQFKLKENVPAQCILNIVPEGTNSQPS